jgi:hypothetical protein
MDKLEPETPADEAAMSPADQLGTLWDAYRGDLLCACEQGT